MKISELLHKDNNNLDLIRIILASLVIIGHGSILNGLSAYWTDPIGYFFNFTYSASLAVKAFFFISGLVVTNSYLQKRDAVYFIISRIFRIIPALFVVLVATVFIFGPVLTTLNTDGYFSNLNHFAYITNNLIFTTEYYLPGLFADNPYPHAVNGSLWSLRYEIGCYLFLLAAFLLLGKRNKYYLNIPIALVIADSLLENPILFSFLGSNPDINLLPISFAFGCLLAVNAEKLVINLYIFLGAFIFLFIFQNTPYGQIILMSTFCISIVYISSRKLLIKFKPRYDISYGIYLWGFLIQQTTFYYLGSIYVGLHCVIALVVSIVLALLTNVVIEKPFINLGKKVYQLYKQKMPF